MLQVVADQKRSRRGSNLTGGAETVGSLPVADDRRGLDLPNSANSGQSVSARQSIVSRPVPVSPLSVLLPRLGEAKELERVLDILSERLEDLREEQPPATEDAMRAKMLEEEMLLRVVGWAAGEPQLKRNRS